MLNLTKGKKDPNDIKVTWTITAHPHADDYLTNKNRAVQFTTKGFDKYGGYEIFGIGRAGNAQKYASLINLFGRMFAAGEEFGGEMIHTIGKDRKHHDYRFYVRYLHDEYGDMKIIYLMPDFDWDIDNGKTKLKPEIDW